MTYATRLPLLNRVVLEELDAVANPRVAGRGITATGSSGIVVGSVQVDELLHRVQSHPTLGDVDDIDVLGALSGLEACEYITINDPGHVIRHAELVASVTGRPVTDALTARRLIVAIHPHTGRQKIDR